MKRDELLGLAEVAETLGTSRRNALRWTRRDDFPEPLVRLKATPVWAAADVRAWAKRTLPLPGRRTAAEVLRDAGAKGDTSKAGKVAVRVRGSSLD